MQSRMIQYMNQYLSDCNWTQTHNHLAWVVVGLIPVAVTWTSDFAPGSSKEFLDIQATIEREFTLKRVRDMTRTYSQYESMVPQVLANVLKLSNIEITDWTNMAYSMLTGCLNAFNSLFSALGFSSGSFSVGSSSKSKLDRKYDSKEFHCINVL